MEWMRWILGISMVTGGASVAIHAAWRFQADFGRAWWARLEVWLKARETRAREAALEAEEAEVQARANDTFESASLQEAIRFERIPLRQTGRDQHYDLQTWARMLAWLVYARLVPGVGGRVGSPLNPTMFKTRVDDARQLGRFLWTRIFVDEAVAQNIRHYYNLDPRELNEKLRLGMVEILEGFLDEPCFRFYEEQLVVNVFECNLKQATCFTADFLPLLPAGPEPLPCEAYLLLGSGQGRVTAPAPDQTRIQFTDQVLGLKQGYYPLLPEVAAIIEVGPHPWCHIQTHKSHCEGTLSLGWRETDEIGVGGILEVRGIQAKKGETFFLRHQVGDSLRDDTLTAPTKTRLTTLEEGKQTTCEIWRRLAGGESLLLTLVMRNRRPPLDSLPDCAIFEDAFAEIEDERQIARFIAGQIYFATKRQKNIGDILWLHGPMGANFLSQSGAVFSQGRKREPLRCRVKLCVSPTRLNQLYEWMGDRHMPARLAATVLDIIREEDDYRRAFPPEALPDFISGEGSPGLSVEVGSDNMLGPDVVLVRCLPVFVPNRRREIYGRLHFEQWTGARDRSDFSCKEGVTFFTDYPSGMVALHLSRFPVYEVCVPHIFGAIKVHVIEPGGNGAKLKIDNHSSAALTVEGKALHRPASATIDCSGRAERAIELTLGEQRASVVIYDEPLAQLDEPHFVPEPARLELHGLTLHRRLERTGWETARGFRALWDTAALHEGKQLLGISQVTDNGYLAVIERAAQMEHHLFAGEALVLNQENEEELAAGKNTLGGKGLGNQAKLWESDAANVQVDYQRLDFSRHRIVNAPVLTFDYWDYWIEDLEALLPEGERVLRVELARCDPQQPGNRDAHLFLVETTGEGETRRGWFWHKEAGITRVRRRGLAQALDLQRTGGLVGPFNDLEGKLFLLDWCHEQGTPVSFDLEDHEEQVRRYLSDGFFSLNEDAPYNVGGKLGGDRRGYKSSEPLFISGSELYLHHDPSGNTTRETLNFDPREFANFFDKDSFKIYYSGDAQSFVIESCAHRKEAITPKTVFMVIPEGGHAILGSHALSPVKIPAGVNMIVLPGLTFKFSQGPVYYA